MRRYCGTSDIGYIEEESDDLGAVYRTDIELRPRKK